VPADYGFHIFQVTERLPAEVAPLEQVRSEVVERLRQESADRRLAGLVQQAKSRYPVFVYERNLPFHYQGTYSGHQKSKQTCSDCPSRDPPGGARGVPGRCVEPRRLAGQRPHRDALRL
jgi:hypothetical protein